MTDSVRVERDGAVGRIVFDRPDANNAMDATAAEGLRAAAADLASDDDCRCIVFAGVGGAFNTGADLTALGDERDETAIRALAGTLHEFDGALRSGAEALAAGPTRAYAETRELLWTSLDHGLGEQLAREADRIAGLTRTADYRAGYAAFFGEEPPEFTGE